MTLGIAYSEYIFAPALESPGAELSETIYVSTVYLLNDIALPEPLPVGYTLFPHQSYGGLSVLLDKGYFHLAVVYNAGLLGYAGLEQHAATGWHKGYGAVA